MLHHRQFKDYETYQELQGYKARNSKGKIWNKIPSRIKGFQKGFLEVKAHLRPGNMLCLGARTGCEVIGAEKAGFKGSVGVDLHPIGESVIKADWSSMPFKDSSFDNIFTNSIDHVFNLDGLVIESKRVLKPGGIFLLYVPFPEKEEDRARHDLEYWLATAQLEGLYWDKPVDVAHRFIDFDFTQSHYDVKGKWHRFFLECKK